MSEFKQWEALTVLSTDLESRSVTGVTLNGEVITVLEGQPDARWLESLHDNEGNVIQGATVALSNMRFTMNNAVITADYGQMISANPDTDMTIVTPVRIHGTPHNHNGQEVAFASVMGASSQHIPTDNPDAISEELKAAFISQLNDANPNNFGLYGRRGVMFRGSIQGRNGEYQTIKYEFLLPRESSPEEAWNYLQTNPDMQEALTRLKNAAQYKVNHPSSNVIIDAVGFTNMQLPNTSYANIPNYKQAVSSTEVADSFSLTAVAFDRATNKITHAVPLPVNNIENSLSGLLGNNHPDIQQPTLIVPHDILQQVAQQAPAQAQEQPQPAAAAPTAQPQPTTQTQAGFESKAGYPMAWRVINGRNGEPAFLHVRMTDGSPADPETLERLNSIVSGIKPSPYQTKNSTHYSFHIGNQRDVLAHLSDKLGTDPFYIKTIESNGVQSLALGGRVLERGYKTLAVDILKAAGAVRDGNGNSLLAPLSAAPELARLIGNYAGALPEHVLAEAIERETFESVFRVTPPSRSNAPQSQAQGQQQQGQQQNTANRGGYGKANSFKKSFGTMAEWQKRTGLDDARNQLNTLRHFIVRVLERHGIDGDKTLDSINPYNTSRQRAIGLEKKDNDKRPQVIVEMLPTTDNKGDTSYFIRVAIFKFGENADPKSGYAGVYTAHDDLWPMYHRDKELGEITAAPELTEEQKREDENARLQREEEARQKQIQEERNKQRSRENLIRDFPSMEQEDGSNPYFADKNILNAIGSGSIDMRKGVDHEGNPYSVYLLYDANNNIAGGQRLYHHSDKAFVYGTQMANPSTDIRLATHAVFGDINSNTTRIHYVEGLADAATIHAATGNPAVIALSAGNLDSVVSTFTSRHPNLEHVICCDSDDHKPKVGNVGSRAGLDAAFKYNTMLVVPNFKGINFGDNNPPTDINDLQKYVGLQAVAQQLSNPMTMPDSEFEYLMMRTSTFGTTRMEADVNEVMARAKELRPELSERELSEMIINQLRKRHDDDAIKAEIPDIFKEGTRDRTMEEILEENRDAAAARADGQPSQPEKEEPVAEVKKEAPRFPVSVELRDGPNNKGYTLIKDNTPDDPEAHKARIVSTLSSLLDSRYFAENRSLGGHTAPAHIKHIAAAYMHDLTGEAQLYIRKYDNADKPYFVVRGDFTDEQFKADIEQRLAYSEPTYRANDWGYRIDMKHLNAVSQSLKQELTPTRNRDFSLGNEPTEEVKAPSEQRKVSDAFGLSDDEFREVAIHAIKRVVDKTVEFELKNDYALQILISQVEKEHEYEIANGSSDFNDLLNDKLDVFISSSEIYKRLDEAQAERLNHIHSHVRQIAALNDSMVIPRQFNQLSEVEQNALLPFIADNVITYDDAAAIADGRRSGISEKAKELVVPVLQSQLYASTAPAIENLVSEEQAITIDEAPEIEEELQEAEPDFDVNETEQDDAEPEVDEEVVVEPLAQEETTEIDAKPDISEPDVPETEEQPQAENQESEVEQSEAEVIEESVATEPLASVEDEKVEVEAEQEAQPETVVQVEEQVEDDAQVEVGEVETEIEEVAAEVVEPEQPVIAESEPEPIRLTDLEIDAIDLLETVEILVRNNYTAEDSYTLIRGEFVGKDGEVDEEHLKAVFSVLSTSENLREFGWEPKPVGRIANLYGMFRSDLANERIDQLKDYFVTMIEHKGHMTDKAAAALLADGVRFAGVESPYFINGAHDFDAINDDLEIVFEDFVSAAHIYNGIAKLHTATKEADIGDLFADENEDIGVIYQNASVKDKSNPALNDDTVARAVLIEGHKQGSTLFGITVTEPDTNKLVEILHVINKNDAKNYGKALTSGVIKLDATRPKSALEGSLIREFDLAGDKVHLMEYQEAGFTDFYQIVHTKDGALVDNPILDDSQEALVAFTATMDDLIDKQAMEAARVKQERARRAKQTVTDKLEEWAKNKVEPEKVITLLQEDLGVKIEGALKEQFDSKYDSLLKRYNPPAVAVTASERISQLNELFKTLATHQLSIEEVTAEAFKDNGYYADDNPYIDEQGKFDRKTLFDDLQTKGHASIASYYDSIYKTIHGVTSNEGVIARAGGFIPNEYDASVELRPQFESLEALMQNAPKNEEEVFIPPFQEWLRSDASQGVINDVLAVELTLVEPKELTNKYSLDQLTLLADVYGVAVSDSATKEQIANDVIKTWNDRAYLSSMTQNELLELDNDSLAELMQVNDLPHSTNKSQNVARINKYVTQTSAIAQLRIAQYSYIKAITDNEAAKHHIPSYATRYVSEFINDENKFLGAALQGIQRTENAKAINNALADIADYKSTSALARNIILEAAGEPLETIGFQDSKKLGVDYTADASFDESIKESQISYAYQLPEGISPDEIELDRKATYYSVHKNNVVSMGLPLDNEFIRTNKLLPISENSMLSSISSVSSLAERNGYLALEAVGSNPAIIAVKNNDKWTTYEIDNAGTLSKSISTGTLNDVLLDNIDKLDLMTAKEPILELAIDGLRQNIEPAFDSPESLIKSELAQTFLHDVKEEAQEVQLAVLEQRLNDATIEQAWASLLQDNQEPIFTLEELNGALNSINNIEPNAPSLTYDEFLEKVGNMDLAEYKAQEHRLDTSTFHLASPDLAIAMYNDSDFDDLIDELTEEHITHLEAKEITALNTLISSGAIENIGEFLHDQAVVASMGLTLEELKAAHDAENELIEGIEHKPEESAEFVYRTGAEVLVANGDKVYFGVIAESTDNDFAIDIRNPLNRTDAVFPRDAFSHLADVGFEEFAEKHVDASSYPAYLSINPTTDEGLSQINDLSMADLKGYARFLEARHISDNRTELIGAIESTTNAVIAAHKAVSGIADEITEQEKVALRENSGIDTNDKKLEDKAATWLQKKQDNLHLSVARQQYQVFKHLQTLAIEGVTESFDKDKVEVIEVPSKTISSIADGGLTLNSLAAIDQGNDKASKMIAGFLLEQNSLKLENISSIDSPANHALRFQRDPKTSYMQWQGETLRDTNNSVVGFETLAAAANWADNNNKLEPFKNSTGLTCGWMHKGEPRFGVVTADLGDKFEVQPTEGPSTTLNATQVILTNSKEIETLYNQVLAQVDEVHDISDFEYTLKDSLTEMTDEMEMGGQSDILKYELVQAKIEQTQRQLDDASYFLDSNQSIQFKEGAFTLMAEGEELASSNNILELAAASSELRLESNGKVALARVSIDSYELEEELQAQVEEKLAKQEQEEPVIEDAAEVEEEPLKVKVKPAEEEQPEPEEPEVEQQPKPRSKGASISM